MKSVYSAVRTGSLNKAVCASYLKGYHLQANLKGLSLIAQQGNQFFVNPAGKLLTKEIEGRTEKCQTAVPSVKRTPEFSSKQRRKQRARL
jgi:hypothetical protein